MIDQILKRVSPIKADPKRIQLTLNQGFSSEAIATMIKVLHQFGYPV